ncbi:hypothetical protein JCGZ_25328 [Jatropha curcas]|uniref:Cytochrome P450 n=2 Tax=Jatropha curcas TaxID=180498 RepID=A0A067JLJ0_JATCU|nr:hypothetical protein JCGZ_25328 [Jatropha curcas]
MEREKFLTEEFIQFIFFGVLFATYESISLTVALIFKFLESHPSVLAELMIEHENILKSRQDSESSITWDDYKSMTFTQQVISETLRLGTTAPGLCRKAVKDIQFKGFTIPTGWNIMMVTSIRHINPEVYKDPLEFNPWRWKDMDSFTISKNFSPFGGGTRQCVGAEYSRLVIALFLHLLITKYR